MNFLSRFTIRTRLIILTVDFIAVVLLIGGLVLALFVAIATIRGMSRAVRALDDAAAAMAEGRLGERADESGLDELSEVARSFNRVGDKFRKTVEEVSRTVRRLTKVSITIIGAPQSGQT